MEPLLLVVLVSAGVVLITATAAVLLVRLALTGTESRDRAAVLNAVAGIIRAVRGTGLERRRPSSRSWDSGGMGHKACMFRTARRRSAQVARVRSRRDSMSSRKRP